MFSEWHGHLVLVSHFYVSCCNLFLRESIASFISLLFCSLLFFFHFLALLCIFWGGNCEMWHDCRPFLSAFVLWAYASLHGRVHVCANEVIYIKKYKYIYIIYYTRRHSKKKCIESSVSSSLSFLYYCINFWREAFLGVGLVFGDHEDAWETGNDRKDGDFCFGTLLKAVFDVFCLFFVFHLTTRCPPSHTPLAFPPHSVAFIVDAI